MSFKEAMDFAAGVQIRHPLKLVATVALIFGALIFLYMYLTWKWWKKGIEAQECIEHGKTTRTRTRRGKIKTTTECLEYKDVRIRWPLWIGLLVVMLFSYTIAKNIVFFSILATNPKLLGMYIASWVVGESAQNVVGGVSEGWHGGIPTDYGSGVDYGSGLDMDLGSGVEF